MENDFNSGMTVTWVSMLLCDKVGSGSVRGSIQHRKNRRSCCQKR